MKRLICSVLLLAVSVSAALAEFFYVSNSADSYSDKIEEVDRLVRKDDFETALQLCESIDSDWSSTAENIDIMLIHDYVDSIGLSLSQMKAHIENRNPDMYFAESAGAKKGLASIKGSEYPNFENIL